MAERVNVTSIKIRPGMRQDADFDAPDGTIDEAVNVRFPTPSAAVPRPGTLAIPPTTTSTAATIQNNAENVGALFTFGNSGALAIAGNVFAWDDDASKFEAQGNYSTCLPIRKRSALTILTDSYGYTKYGMAVGSLGHICSAAARQSIASVFYRVETADGICQLSGALSGHIKATVLAMGTDFVLIAQNGTAINAMPITYAAGVWTAGAAVNIHTLNANTNHWDACVESSTVFHVASQIGAAQARLRSWTFPTMVGGAGALFAIVGQPVFSIFVDAANVWVGFNDDPGVTGNVTVRIYTLAYGVTLGATIIGTSALYGGLILGPARDGSTSGKTFACWSTTTPGAPPYSTGIWVCDLTTAGVATTQFTPGVYPVMKPGADGRVWCVTGSKLRWSPSAPLGTAFSRNVLLRWVDLAHSEPPQLELATDEFFGNLTRASNIDDMVLVAEASGPARVYPKSSRSTFALLPDIVSANSGIDTIRLQVYEYERSAVFPWRQAADVGVTSLVAGQPIEIGAKGSSGTPTANFVRRSGVPVGFLHRPDMTAAVQGAAGGLTAAATYSWAVIYEWVDDATGRVHRSAVSPVYTTLLTVGNTQVTFTIHGCPGDVRCGDSSYSNPPAIAVYRSRANESQLRRESSGATTFDANTDTITYVSTVADSFLGDFLYTENGTVEYSLAPSCRYVCRTESASVLGGLWDRRILHKLRDFFPGEPAQSSDLQSWDVYLPEDCFGLAYQDGITYAFGRNSVMMVTGDGPNDQGNGFFDPVRTLTSEFGCRDERSVIETSVGVFFLSDRGFMLIPRGGASPMFIGAGIQKDVIATTSAGTAGWYVCLGAACVSGKSRTARFLMTNGTTERIYIYDFDTQAWSYDTLANSARLAAIGVWPNGFVAARDDLSSATVCAYLESATAFSDGSGSDGITSMVRFSELRPWGLAGWGRCQSVMAVMSEPGLDATGVPTTLTVTPDDLATAQATRTWTVTSAGDGQTLYRAVDCPHMQCSSTRVQWSTARTAAAAAQGPELNAIVLSSVAEQGARILQPSER